MKIIYLIIIVSTLFLTSCEKRYGFTENNYTDPNYPENMFAIDTTIDISEYIVTSNNVEVVDFDFDSQNNMWVATDKGLVKISKTGSEFYSYPNNDSYDILVNTLSIDSEDNIWLTSSFGILQLPNSNSQYTLYCFENGLIPTNNTSRIFCDTESNQYFVHAFGVCKFENRAWLADDKFPEWSNFENLDSISFNKKKPIMIEKDDYFWIATFNGIIKYKSNTTYEVLTNSPSGGNIFAHAIYIDNTNSIWIQLATPAVLSIANGSWTFHYYKGNLTIAGNFVVVESYTENGNDIQFFEKGEWLNSLKKYYFNLSSFNDVRVDKDGHLWFSQYGYLHEIKPEVFQ